jgi:hypothetical protein
VSYRSEYSCGTDTEVLVSFEYLSRFVGR